MIRLPSMNPSHSAPPSFLRRKVSSLSPVAAQGEGAAHDAEAILAVKQPPAPVLPTIKPLPAPAAPQAVPAPPRLRRAQQAVRQVAVAVAPLAVLVTMVGIAQLASFGGTQAAAEPPPAIPAVAVAASITPSPTPTPISPPPPRPTLPANRLPLALALGAAPRSRATLPANSLPLTLALGAAPRGTAVALRPQPEIRATPQPRVAAGRPIEPGPWPEVPAGGAPNRVRAPAIGMDAPVEGVGSYIENVGGAPIRFYETAMEAAGWHDNSALPGHIGNIVMAGHHNIGSKVFEHVVDLEMGDYIFLDVDDRTYPYQVVLKEILPEANVSEAQRAENGRWMNPTTDERLTLITCWPPTDNTHRVIVVAYPVKTIQN